MSEKIQSSGRARNAAQPLGDRRGVISDAATRKTGKKSQKAAGPDGPDPTIVGDTFKRS